MLLGESELAEVNLAGGVIGEGSAGGVRGIGIIRSNRETELAGHKIATFEDFQPRDRNISFGFVGIGEDDIVHWRFYIRLSCGNTCFRIHRSNHMAGGRRHFQCAVFLFLDGYFNRVGRSLIPVGIVGVARLGIIDFPHPVYQGTGSGIIGTESILTCGIILKLYKRAIFIQVPNPGGGYGSLPFACSSGFNRKGNIGLAILCPLGIQGIALGIFPLDIRSSRIGKRCIVFGFRIPRNGA